MSVGYLVGAEALQLLRLFKTTVTLLAGVTFSMPPSSSEQS